MVVVLGGSGVQTDKDTDKTHERERDTDKDADKSVSAARRKYGPVGHVVRIGTQRSLVSLVL